MNSQKRFRRLAALALAVMVALSCHVSAVQKDSKKEKEPAPQGTPVLWRDPGDVSALDLFAGPGGEEMKPDVSSVTFVKDESAGGYSPKFRVTDGAGKTWVAKFGKEAQPETAAVRLAWAVGYVTEVSYLVPCVQIKGAPEPRKKVDRCDDKGFANVRFEARPDEWKRLDNWSWGENPFKGTKEFQGLVVLMGLINNWDLKDTNNKIVYVPGDGGEGELRYIISDLGATFGKTGNFITHDRNAPENFAKSKFVEKVENGHVKFSYDGKNSGLFHGISVENARWIGEQLSRLSDKQIEDAFRAANYSGADLQTLVAEVRSRVQELTSLPGPAGVAADAQPQSSPE